jgi:predicted DCC family thiol-disulfide oxidoreductase YuxK
MREVNMLQKRDATQNNIAFIDIASPSYNPADHAGISYQDAMERIHAILPDGQIVTDVEVFRRLYEQVGLGWVYSITRIPAVEKAANVVYNVWAKNRMGLTGREDLEVILQQKQTCGVKGGSSSVDGKEA